MASNNTNYADFNNTACIVENLQLLSGQATDAHNMDLQQELTKSKPKIEKKKLDLSDWRRWIPFGGVVVLALGVIVGVIVCIGGKIRPDARNQLDAPSPLPQLARSGRGRRHLRNQPDAGNVCQLEGLNLTQHEVGDIRTKISKQGNVTIADWQRAPWLPDSGKWKKNFAVKNDGILVKRDGIYFVYANFPFTGNGGSGTECAYQLRYGNNNNNNNMINNNNAINNNNIIDNNKVRYCRWKIDASTGSHTIANIHQCYLGFVARMSRGDRLKIIFNHNERCKTNVHHFKNNQFLSVLGIIKQ